MKWKTFWNIVVGMYVVALIVLVGLIVMVSMNKAVYDYCSTICNQSNGTLIYYPVDDKINFYVPINKSGFWCKLSDGTEIDVNVKEIINKINPFPSGSKV